MSEADLRTQDWSALHKRLTAYAYRRLGRRSMEIAEETATDVIAQLFDPAYARWDPTKQDLFTRLTSVINGIVVKKRLRRLVTKPLHFSADLMPTQPGKLSPHVLAVDAAEAQAHAELVERVAGDPVAAKILELVGAHVDDPFAQAEAAGESIYDVRLARRRLATEAEEIAHGIETS